MADISDINSAQTVKIVGADATGVEQTPVQSTSNGGIHTNLRNTAGTEIATSSDPLKIDPTGTTSQPVNNTTASNLNAQIVGNIANAATDSGNPVKIGGVYKTTIPLLTENQRGDVLLDENSNFSVVKSESMLTAQQKVFSAVNTAAFVVGTSEAPAFFLKNPNGSGIKLRILKIFFTGAATYRLYHTPTTSANGTALTAINQRIMTSPAAAVGTAFQAPTVSVNGTLIMLNTVSAQSGTKELNLEHQLILNPNFNLLITAIAGANNTPVSITVIWCEVP